MASMAEKGVAVNHKLNGILYGALLKGEKEKVIDHCQYFDLHAMHIITMHKDTVLHVATYAKHVELVLELLAELPDSHRNKMTHQNCKGNTILHEAATLDPECSVKVAKKMLEKGPDLLSMTNKLGETALFRAARYGNTKVFKWLADQIPGSDEATQRRFIQRTDKTTILHAAVLACHFGLALEIAKEFRHIIGEGDKDGMTALQLLSCNPSAFEAVHNDGPFKRISGSLNEHSSSAWVKDDSGERNKDELLELVKLLVKKDTSWASINSEVGMGTAKPHEDSGSSSASPKEPQKDASSSSPFPIEKGNEDKKRDKQVEQQEITPLFLATESGCIEIVKEILETYPQAVGQVDSKGRTILHIAIMHRQMEVFSLVLKMEVAKRWLVRRLDNDGNSILHMVGMERKNMSRKSQGPVFELQDELLLFERVKSITGDNFSDYRNSMTAENLFVNTKEDLRNEAREWLKHTANGCSIVAVLIATVSFTSAYTIPGGANQETGAPVLLPQPFFLLFTAADVLSVACALNSVVIFLSILTAPFQFEDFKHSLPRKLMLGLTSLFASVLMMMVAFGRQSFSSYEETNDGQNLSFIAFASFLSVSLHYHISPSMSL